MSWGDAEPTDGAGDCFVGRHEERSRLRALLETAPVCALFGPAGVGKTELALRTVAEMRAENRLPPVRYTSLAEAPADAGVLEQARRHQARHAGEPACMLVLDDVAPESRAAVRKLVAAQASPASRVLVLSRERVLADAPSLELRPLGIDECRELVARLDLGNGSVYERIADSSGGNPLVLRTMLAAIGRLELPDDVTQALTQFVAELDERARALLELIVAAAQPLDVAVLCAANPEQERDLRRLADRHLVTIRDGALQVVGGVEGHLRTLLGAPTAATHTALAALADRWLAVAPDSPEALRLAVDGRLRRGRAAEGFALLERFGVARAAMPVDRVSALVSTIIAADDAPGAEAKLMLARTRLRGGDVRGTLAALQALADSLSGPQRRQMHLLRAAALLRSADAAGVARELALAAAHSDAGDDDPAVVLAREELALLAGDWPAARVRLVERAALLDVAPALACRRATLIAFSFVMDESFAEALAWCERAHRIADVERQPWALPLVETRALVALGLVPRAVDALGRMKQRRAQGLGTGLYEVCQAMVMNQRGELTAVLAELAGSLPLMRMRGDTLGATLLALCLSRASFGAGDPPRAEAYARQAETITSNAAFAALALFGHVESMLLSAMRCDWPNAVAHAHEAHASCPASPFVCVDDWWARRKPWDDVTAAPVDAARAYFDLRAAERALAEGHADLAECHAALAQRWYDRAGDQFNHALALLARAEAVARLGQRQRCEALLARLVELAERRGYAVVMTAAMLVRASLADRGGDLGGYVAALDGAHRVAGERLQSGALAAACRRVALDHAAASGVDGQPFRDRIRRLGLDRAAVRLCTSGSDVYLLDGDEPLPDGGDVVLDIDAGVARTARDSRELQRQALLLLASVAETGADGIDIEELFLRVWGGSEFHPLRHRNAIYVAVNRLRAAMQSLVAEEVVRKRSDGRYAVDGGVRVVVVRALPVPAWQGRTGAPRDEQAYARAFGLSVAQARWELALARAAGSDLAPAAAHRRAASKNV